MLVLSGKCLVLNAKHMDADRIAVGIPATEGANDAPSYAYISCNSNRICCSSSLDFN